MKTDPNRGPKEMKTRIVIVDDHPIVRHGIRQLLTHEPDLEVVGEASSAPEALSLIQSARPELVLIDVSLEKGSGLELVKQIRSQDRSIRVLVVSMHDEILFADRALTAGAMGYITKEKATDDLINAIRQVLSGKVYLSQRMTERMLRRLVDKVEPTPESPIERLSNREVEVLELIGRAVSTREIANRLQISVKTVETHREHIKQKLDLDTNLQLVRWAVQWAFEQGRAKPAEERPE